MQISEINLLVVEDDAFQRRMMVNMLHSLGAATIADVGNGKEALEIVRQMDPQAANVALCDLNMPEMDGMEFLRHLGQERRNIAVVIISALDRRVLASVGRMVKMYGLKLLGTVEKPIFLKDLQALLMRYEHTENKWNPPAGDEIFSLADILHGVDADQFEPFFQPKVDLKSGRVVGAEVLARWMHPQHGMIDPAAFIPQLEQSGNIDDLTLSMLKKSAAACRLFHAMGKMLTISINVSLVSLNDSALSDKITGLVRECGIDPCHIVLEITESAAVSDGARVLENLARLCMNGFSLSIDDYGTGYSSMQQLTRIAFSELKIDQSFVRDCTDNEALSIVVESSIDMAHKLQMKSTAEGVETQADLDTLTRMGCDTGQGYLFGQPMNLTAFMKWEWHGGAQAKAERVC